MNVNFWWLLRSVLSVVALTLSLLLFRYSRFKGITAWTLRELVLLFLRCALVLRCLEHGSLVYEILITLSAVFAVVGLCCVYRMLHQFERWMKTGIPQP